MSDTMISNLIDIVFIIAFGYVMLGGKSGTSRRQSKNDVIEERYANEMAEWRMNFMFTLDEKTFNVLDECGFRNLCDPKSKHAFRNFGDVLVNAAIHGLNLVEKVKDPSFLTDPLTCRRIEVWISKNVHYRIVAEVRYIDEIIRYLRRKGAFKGQKTGNLAENPL